MHPGGRAKASGVVGGTSPRGGALNSGGWTVGGSDEEPLGGVGSVYNNNSNFTGTSPEDSPEDYIEKDEYSDGYLKVVFPRQLFSSNR